MIGEIRVDAQDMFDPQDPRENSALYRLANFLHINTRPSVIRRALLFKTGDPVSVRLIEETERLLRTSRFLYAVSIRPLAHRDGVVDLEVKTRDTWSLEPGIKVGRSGGVNSGGISIEEANFLGTGVGVGLTYKSDVDRSGTTFHLADSNVLGSRAVLAYSFARQDDGKNQSIALARPFYALDSRWSAGISASENDGIDAIYNSGVNVGEYRHQKNAAETFAGWSKGLIDGWVRRYSFGLLYEDHHYELEPGRTPPARLPSDLTLVAPFLRLEVVEDAYRKGVNLDLIGRIEDLAMGLQSKFQLGRALSALGSSRDLWLYSGSVLKGYNPTPRSILLTTGSMAGRYAGRAENLLMQGTARYFLRRDEHFAYFASAAVDLVRHPDVPGTLQLGGDNGLRGYPLRYQSGERRALFTLEARAYSDWYPLRLIRLGGAVFFDLGRAWGGENQNSTHPGWLSDVGFGLRFFSDRSAFGNVLHADIAFPLNRDPSIKSAQFIVRTKISL